MGEPSERIVSPGSSTAEVDGHVRLRARVRLDVGVLGSEELLRAVDRELLDLVDDLAAAVVAPARIALGVLVRRHAADGLEHARPGEVLGGDQLDLAALAVELVGRAARRSRDRRRRAARGGGLRRSPSSSGRRWSGAPLRSYSARPPTTSRAPRRRAPRPRAARAAQGRSGRPRSTAVPGSSPPSTTAQHARRSSAGTSSSRRGSAPPWRLALVAATAPTRASDRRPRPGSTGTRTPIVSGALAASQREPSRRVREDQRVRPGQDVRDAASGRSSGTSSSSDVDVGGDERDRLTPAAPLQPRTAGAACARRRRTRPYTVSVGRTTGSPARRSPLRRRLRVPSSLDHSVASREVGSPIATSA